MKTLRMKWNFSDYEDYETARKYNKRALDTSNVETQSEGESKKRKQLVPSRFLSDTEIDSEGNVSALTKNCYETYKSILLAGFIGGDCRFPLHLSVCLSVCLSHFRILRFWCLSSAYCYNAIVTFGKTMRTLQCCLPTQGLNGSGCVMSWLCDYVICAHCYVNIIDHSIFTLLIVKKKRNALNLIFMNWCAFFFYFKGECVPSPPKKHQLRQC